MSTQKKQAIVISHRAFMSIGMILLLVWNSYQTSNIQGIITNINYIPTIIENQKKDKERIREIRELLAKHNIATHDGRTVTEINYE